MMDTIAQSTQPSINMVWMQLLANSAARRSAVGCVVVRGQSNMEDGRWNIIGMMRMRH